MNDRIPFHHYTPLQNMIINIRADGEEKVWNFIETFSNPFTRREARDLFAQAIQKIKEK